MFKERFIQVKQNLKERFTKPQPIDVAEKLLNERFQSLNLTTQEIDVFGVDFLQGLMDKEALKNLKVAKKSAKEKASEFNTEVIEPMGDSERAQNVKNKLQGTLAFGALKITREVLKDESLSYRKKKRKLVFLETFLSENGISSEHSKFLVKEGKKEVKKQELVSNLKTGAKFIVGVALGALGAEYAEKYVSFLPAAQEALGLALIVGTTTSRAATKLMSEKSSKWKKIDKALSNIQPVLIGVGAGLVGHGIYDQLTAVNDVVLNHGSLDGGSRLEGIHKQPIVETPSVQVPTAPAIPEPSVTVVEPVNTLSYVVSGNEYGGITDIAQKFYGDAYGQEMTQFILDNKDTLTDQSRVGHEAATKLIDFLQSNSTYTWRDAMNESAKEGHATEISKLFTEGLKFIRPGTTFIVPGQ